MKELKYIYMLLVTMLLGFVISSCDDDDVIGSEKESDEIIYSGVKVKTSFKVGVSAPDVSSDIEVETRSVDNANIDYAQPENGGRFKNIVIVLVDDNQRVLSMHCKEFENVSGVKEYNYVFSDIEIPVEHIGQKQYQVYAFGNVCAEHYAGIVNTDAKRDFQNNHVNLSGLNVNGYCVNNTISLNPDKCNNINQPFYNPVSDIPYYCINFKPEVKYILNQGTVTSTGMPENRSAKAVVMKGNTQFNIVLKRVCARVKFTFRNFTGQYVDENGRNVDNDIYIDEFLTTAMLTNSTSYFYNSDNYTYSFPSNNGTKFNILQVLGCRKYQQYTPPLTESDHVYNKIANKDSLTISMYVFENNCGDWKYNLRIDRGRSLGNRAGKLEDGNIYVMWNDNIDKGNFKNTQNYCLGVDDNDKVQLVPMNSSTVIPYGSGEYGNRVFWRYNGKKLESCKVNLNTDLCTYSNKYISQFSPETAANEEYPLALTEWNGQEFSEVSSDFGSGVNRVTRKRLKHHNGIIGDYYLQVSSDKLYSRYITDFVSGEKSYPWVFFAKYIIRNESFKANVGSNQGPINKIERNNNYEFEFNVMPNYTDEEDLQVRCVRKQNEITWSEVEK